jgi:parvulin-like peptidyl-prolyl isomerase
MAGFCPKKNYPTRLDDPLCPNRRPLPICQDRMGVEFSCPHELKAALGGMLRQLLCSLLFILIIATGGMVQAATGLGIDLPAAVVNGTKINHADFQLELDRVQRQHGISAKLAGEGTMAELKREALENLITRELLYQESRRRAITVPVAEVDHQLQQLKGQFANEGQFVTTLAKLKMNEDQVREQVTRGLAIQRLIDELIGSKLTATDAELRVYYDQHPENFTEPSRVRLSHILLVDEKEFTPEMKRALRKKMTSIRERLVAGEDFGHLAREVSDCQSKNKGGDIGWFTPGQVSPTVEKAVSMLKVGELTDIVEDRFGLHIIKVTERKEAVLPPLAGIKDKVKAQLKQEKGQKELQPLVRKLRDGAKVELYLQGADE